MRLIYGPTASRTPTCRPYSPARESWELQCQLVQYLGNRLHARDAPLRHPRRPAAASADARQRSLERATGVDTRVLRCGQENGGRASALWAHDSTEEHRLGEKAVCLRESSEFLERARVSDAEARAAHPTRPAPPRRTVIVPGTRAARPRAAGVAHRPYEGAPPATPRAPGSRRATPRALARRGIAARSPSERAAPPSVRTRTRAAPASSPGRSCGRESDRSRPSRGHGSRHTRFDRCPRS
jgi:hypothetical protein